VAISENDELIYEHYIGSKISGKRSDINADTKFRIGSITKVFTAVMIFQLIEEEKLSLDTKLGTYFPNIVNADKITVGQMLNHSSGIHNFTSDPNYPTLMEKKKSQKDLLKIFYALPSDFEPGSSQNYSNTAYILLGFIIENETGNPYNEEVKSRIIDPLDLKRTDYGGKIKTGNNEAQPLSSKDDQWKRFSKETNMSVPRAAGSMVSTVRDLNEFIDGIFNGKLVSEASLNIMKDTKNGIGHGLFVFPFNNKKAYGHNGGIDSFVSNTAHIPDDNMTFSIVANGVNTNFNSVILGVLQIYYGLPFSPPDFSEKIISLDPKTLTNYEGDFSSEMFPLDINITLKKGALILFATGQAAIEISPISKFKFKYEPAGLVILFDEIDGNVNYDQLKMQQQGREFIFERKSEK